MFLFAVTISGTNLYSVNKKKKIWFWIYEQNKKKNKTYLLLEAENKKPTYIIWKTLNFVFFFFAQLLNKTTFWKKKKKKKQQTTRYWFRFMFKIISNDTKWNSLTKVYSKKMNEIKISILQINNCTKLQSLDCNPTPTKKKKKNCS